MSRLDSLRRSYFLPYQWAWIRDEARTKICEKSRRIGWTYASSYRRVRRALTHPGLDAWWMTRDLVTAREFIRYCKRWCDLANTVAQGLEGECVAPLDPRGVMAQEIHFPNGSRIHVLSSNPDAAAGKGGDLGLDEFALHGDQERLYQVAKPVVMWGFQLEIISTHRGRETVFNRLVQAARAGGSEWSHYRVTLPDAVGQGLVDKINAAAARRDLPPITAADFLARERAGCLSEAMWRQEYLCEPQDDANSLLSFALITAAETPWAELRAAADTGAALTGAGPRYAGMDIGRRHDLSVIWVVELLGDVAYTRAAEVLRDVPFHAQLQTLLELLKRYQVRRCAIDATGLGAMLAEEAARQHRGGSVEAITFSAPVKEELAALMLRRFQTRTVRIPDDPALRADLHQVQRQVTTAGNVRYAAPDTDDGHADRFWALALALHAAPLTPPPRATGMRLGTDRAERDNTNW